MKAVLLDGFGGPEVLKIGETQKPVPSEGQVLIKVAATSVNRPDIVQREGNYPPPAGDSEIPGLEVAGVIEETGPGVTSCKRGDRVMSLVGGGGYAQYAVAYAGHLIPIPETMSFESAACVCESYITAFLNIFMIGGFKDGQCVLAHGGGGGVNTAAIQLCRKLAPNSRIMVTASAGKIERVRQLGADLVINYQQEDFAEAVRAFTGKKRRRCHPRSYRRELPCAKYEGACGRRQARDYRCHEWREGRTESCPHDGKAPAHHRLRAAVTFRAGKAADRCAIHQHRDAGFLRRVHQAPYLQDLSA